MKVALHPFPIYECVKSNNASSKGLDGMIVSKCNVDRCLKFFIGNEPVPSSSDMLVSARIRYETVICMGGIQICSETSESVCLFVIAIVLVATEIKSWWTIGVTAAIVVIVAVVASVLIPILVTIIIPMMAIVVP